MYKPTKNDYLFFQEHGWWVSPICLTDGQLSELEIAAKRFLIGERDYVPLINLKSQEAGDNVKSVIQGDYLSLQINEAAWFIKEEILPRLASFLANTPSVRLFHDQLIVKLSSTSEFPYKVGWHTDKAYWKSCTSENMITAWIPLQDTNEDMGPLAVWDKSHKWPNTEEMHTFDIQDLKSLEEKFRSCSYNPEIKVLSMQRGQVSFHHCRLVHGSYENKKKNPRIAYAIHYQDEANQYNRNPQIDGKVSTHINDFLCRRSSMNLPDYSDPEICPVLFPIKNN